MLRVLSAFLLLCALCALAASASAEVRTALVEYREGDTVCEGFLAWDDALKSRRPGVVLVHEWMGLNEHVMERARRLAAQGFVAFGADIYGKGVRAKDRAQAAELSGKHKKDVDLLRRRARAALDTLAGNPHVDPTRIAAIGFCFGGTTVLEMARAGMPVKGVVSFHGGLATSAPTDKIAAKVLVLHGAEDPHVKPQEVAAFMDEMRKAGADWQLVHFGGAVHSFTNPAAGNDPSKGAAYDAKADARSWQYMLDFFKEVLDAV